MKAKNSLAPILALASFLFVHAAPAQRAYTRTHSVKQGENFIWCASYEERAGTVWWRIGRVLSTEDLAHPTLAAPIGSGSAVLAITGSGPYNREEVGYGWPERTWPVPLDTPKGLYAAEFSSDPVDWTGAAIVYFVIRPPSRSSSTKILFCYPFSTTLAYAGAWGSHVNLYDSFQPARARRVSLDRPLSDPKEYYTVHAPFLLEQFIRNLPGNPDIDTCTSFDLHNDPNLLNGYSLFISAGHDEYWSKEMRDHVEGFVASGGNAAFFSANTAWWQVRFRNGNRMMVCHKSGVEDSLAGVDDSRVTGNFASSPANREENTLTGVSYRRGTQGGSATPFTILDPDDPFLSGVPGPTFGSGLFGLETDAADYESDGAGGYRVTGRDGSPLNFKLLAVADMSSEVLAQSGRATMGYFKNHGTTFTAATTDWCFHLGDSSVARITRNVVTILSERTPGPAWTLPTRTYPGAAWSFVENVGTASAIAGIVHGDLFLLSSGAFVRKDPENPSVVSSATAIPVVPDLTCLGSDLWGRLLYAGTANQGIFYRNTHPANPAPWAGHVSPPSVGARCEGIGAITDQIFALFRDGTDQQLYQLMPGENWVRLGGPAPEFQAMTAFDGKLFAASVDGLYCRESASVDLVWTRIGSVPAPGIFSLGAYYGRLFALSGSRTGAALHWHSAVAECQTPFQDPQMLFLRGSATALGRLAGNGDFETLGGSTFTGAYTHVTRANDGLVLFYNRSDGSGSVVRYSNDGGQSVLKDYPAGSFGDWTHIVSAGAGPAGLGRKVLFYNSGGTLGIIGRFDPADGAFHSEWDSSAFATGWSHILSTQNGMLFFYDELTGDGAWGSVTSAGVFSTEGTVSGLLTGWEQIVSAGNGFLFFYNSTGQAALAEVRGSFRTVQDWPPGGFGSNWRLGDAANGLVLFYNPVSGGAITGGFNAAGFVPLHVYPDGAFSSGWERMVKLDRGFLPPLTRLYVKVHPGSGYLIRLQCVPYLSSTLQRAPSPTGPWTTLTTYDMPQSDFVEYHETNSPPGQAFYRTLAEPTPR